MTRSSMRESGRHVQRGRRHPGAQRLHHRVAPDHRLRQLGLPPGRRAPRRATLVVAFRGRGRPARRGMPLARLRGRGRTAPLDGASGLPTRPDDRTLLGTRLAHCAPPLGIAGHPASAFMLYDVTPDRNARSVPSAPGTTRRSTGHRPDRPVLGVLDGESGLGQPHPNGIRPREVPFGPQLGPFHQQRVDQFPGRIDQTPVLTGVGPRRRPGIQSQHPHHGPHRGRDLGCRRVVCIGQRGVPGAHSFVDDGQRPSNTQVVVHGRA